MDEATVQQFIQADGPRFKCQLMRNNCGALPDVNGRWIYYGLGNISKRHSEKIKSSDLVGFTQITITPEMVGKTIAVITAVEVKEPGWEFNPRDKREQAQLAFISWVRAAGGLAGFASSIESFRKILGV